MFTSIIYIIFEKNIKKQKKKKKINPKINFWLACCYMSTQKTNKDM